MSKGHVTSLDIVKALVGEDVVTRMYIGEEVVFIFFEPVDMDSLLINYDAADAT